MFTMQQFTARSRLPGPLPRLLRGGGSRRDAGLSRRPGQRGAGEREQKSRTKTTSKTNGNTTGQAASVRTPPPMTPACGFRLHKIPVAQPIWIF